MKHRIIYHPQLHSFFVCYNDDGTLREVYTVTANAHDLPPEIQWASEPGCNMRDAKSPHDALNFLMAHGWKFPD